MRGIAEWMRLHVPHAVLQPGLLAPGLLVLSLLVPSLLEPSLLIPGRAHGDVLLPGTFREAVGNQAVDHPPVVKQLRRDHLQYVGPQPFDVTHYRLDLTFAMTSEAMGGTVTMFVVPRRGIDSLTLNSAQLAIDSVLVNGVPRSSSVDPAHEEFSVLLGSTAHAGDTLKVAISYRRLPGLRRPSHRLGYYWYPAPLVPENLGYTMSEPSDARLWMPCYDQPWVKSTAEIHATVPAGYVAASNGKLLGTSANADGTVTWHWQEQHRVATYLLAVTISRWAVTSLPLALAPGDTIPVQYYVWQPDSAQCAAYLPTVARMISSLGKLFGSYPFEKYGMAGVAPFSYGGMEHQTITTLARSYEDSEFIVVHELSHQWWGDLVTCGTWKDVWLNESFATYGEALWSESKGGNAALKQYMNDVLQQFDYASWRGAVYDPESQGFALFAQSVYSKGAWVLHTLRGVLGDSLFFGSLRAYRAKYQEAAAVTDDYLAVIDSVTGRHMGWFFQEWVYGPGWPQYAPRFTYANGMMTLTISQMQESAWPTFRMPISVRAFGPGGRDTLFTVLDTARVQRFSLALATAPDSVVLDPDGWILKQVVPGLASEVAAESPRPPAQFGLEQNYPNPFNPQTVLEFTLPTAGKVRLAVYDLLGREVARLADGVMAAGRHSVVFDGSRLASGVYLARLEGTGVSVRKIALVR